MREANEIGSGSGACAWQGCGVRRRSASFRSCSSLGFGLLEDNRRAVQRFARLCSLKGVHDKAVKVKDLESRQYHKPRMTRLAQSNALFCRSGPCRASTGFFGEL